MNNEAHKARAERNPLSAHLVYGYETLDYTGDKPKTTLYAVTTSGQVYTRKTTSRNEFNNVRARWSVVVDLPANAEFVGYYLDDCTRQTA